MLKSLEAYRRSGNRVRQASILSNLGVGVLLRGSLGRRDGRTTSGVATNRSRSATSSTPPLRD